MTALEVEFVDELPGKAPTPSADIAAFADELRKRPGQWAKYPWSHCLAPRSRHSRASDINNGRETAPVAMRTGFEAAVRFDTLYIRCVSEGELFDD